MYDLTVYICGCDDDDDDDDDDSMGLAIAQDPISWYVYKYICNDRTMYVYLYGPQWWDRYFICYGPHQGRLATSCCCG